MAEKKPLYQPWNEEEFQADVFVRGMAPLQRWMYRSLLQAAFFHTTRPYLPNDDEVLWVLAGCESPEQWQQNKTRIMKRFSAVDGQPGLLENKRVSADWEKLLEIRERMSELGQRSAAARQLFSGRSERGPNAPLFAVTAPVNETPASEAIESKEKEGDTKPTAATSDWANLRREHRKFFSKKPDKAHLEHRYTEACSKYGEELVLKLFGEWAETARDWVKRDSIGQPMFAFFKRLPDLASEELAAQDDEKELVGQQAAVQQQEQAASTAVENSVAQQKQADWKRMTQAPPPENGADVSEYVK